MSGNAGYKVESHAAAMIACIYHNEHVVVMCALLQPFRWCCVECVIRHERDVREEQHHTYVARTSNKRVIVAWKLCRY